MKTRILQAIGINNNLQDPKEVIRSHPSRILLFDKKGRTLLHKAVEIGDKDLCDFLLVWGANPNTKDLMGHNSLHSAIIHRQFNIAKFLILNNVSINAVSSTGKTALHFLTNYDEDDEVTDMAKFMLEYGAHPHKKDKSGFSALEQTVKRGNLKLNQVMSSLTF